MSTAIQRLLCGCALALLTLLSACSTPAVQDYANEKPVLELRDYFNGTIDAYGLFTDRNGSVVKRFTVEMRLPIPMAPPNAVSGTSPGWPADAMWALPMMWWVPQKVSKPATPFIGPTRWRCPSMDVSSTSRWTTGCTS
jgi:Protein of unknown function (DUF3833)